MHVFFMQSLVPHYRVPFFERLAAQSGFSLEVHASPEVPGQSLSSVDGVESNTRFACRLHPCVSLAGGRLFRQPGVALPKGFGRGDVFVLPGAPRFPANFAMAAVARARRASVLWFSQGYGLGDGAAATFLRRTAARLCDHAVLYTDAEVQGYVAHGFPARRLTAMNNALDQAPIRAAAAGVTDAQIETLRREHGLEGKRIALFVGRLTEKAQLGVLIEALMHLPPEHVAVIVGGGEEMPVLRTQIAGLRLDDRVRLIGPLFDEARLAPWFRAASTFVYPGAIGLSIHHAFGYGLPVVTHGERREQMPEFAALQPGVNGEVFPRGDARALAWVLRRLAEDAPRLAAMSQAARRTVETGWNIDDMAARFGAALRVAAGR